MAPTRDSAAVLRATLQGRVIAPGDPDFDAARALVCGGLDKRPSAIARVAGADDVARVSTFARESEIELAVRSGGHSIAGHIVAGERAIARFRALAEPIADMVQPIPYPEIYPPEDPDYHPTAVARTMFVDDFGPTEAALIVDRLAASDASLRVVQLRVHGGAIARVPAEATAFAHRSRRMMVNVAAFYEGEEDRSRRQAWVDDLADTLNRGDSSAYVNFLGDEGEDRIRAAYPGTTWDRLRAVKARYDPDNVFRLNQNISPA